MNWLSRTQLTNLNDALLDIHSATGIMGVLRALVSHIPTLVPVGSTAGFCVGEDWQFSESFTPDLNARLFQDYKNYYEPFDIYKQIVFARNPVLPVDISSHLIDYKQWEQSPHRSEFLIPNEMYHLAGIQIVVGDELVGDVCLHREVGASDFSAEESTILHILQRHASLACRNSILYAKLCSPDDALTPIAEKRHGVMIFDHTFKLAYRNALSEQICRKYTKYTASCASLTDTLASVLSFERSVAAAAQETVRTPAWRGSLRMPHGNIDYTVTRASSSSADLLYVVHIALVDDEWSPLDVGQLPFALSNREYEIARLLTHGMSNNIIAMALNVSLNTVKTHLKSIMRKTKTHTRTEVVYTLFGERLSNDSHISADIDIEETD